MDRSIIKPGTIVYCSDISESAALHNTVEFVYIGYDKTSRQHLCQNRTVSADNIEWLYVVPAQTNRQALMPGDIVTVSDYSDEEAISNAFEYVYVEYEESSGQHVVCPLDPECANVILWKYAVRISQMPKECTKEILPGDRVSTSEISNERARENNFAGQYFIGMSTSGKYVVEDIGADEFTTWEYIVPYREDDKYVKSMSEVVKGLEDRGYVFDDGGANRFFVSREAGELFPVLMLGYCGKPVEEVPEEHKGALLDWMVEEK